MQSLRFGAGGVIGLGFRVYWVWGSGVLGIRV